MNKKTQIRLTESIAVLIIFFILVGLGISFYAKYRTYAFENQKEEALQARAIVTTLKALFLPELICSRGEAEPEENCVDMLKARHFQELLGEHFNDYYFDVFSYANITLFSLYPQQEKWQIYAHPKEDNEHSEVTHFVVVLRDELAGEKAVPAYGFGYMQVEVYS